MAENTINKNVIGFFKVLNPERLDEIKTEHPNSFIHFHNEGKEDNLYIGDCRMTDNFNTGDVPDGAKTVKVGGLDSTTIKGLKDMSLSEIVMRMVCPRTVPEPPKNKPSMSISYSGEKLIKVGSTLPTNDNITITYDKGQWSDGTDYAGEPSEPTIQMTPNKWGEKSEEGNYTISGSVHFNDGPIPKDSYGEDLPDKQYKSGDISSNSIRITSVYSIQINTDNITEMKEELVDYINSNPVLRITVPPEEDGTLDKFKIYLPYDFKSIEVKQYNPVSGKYDIQIDMFPMDDCSYHYIRTKDTKNTNTGSAQYEIKLTR